ncbi:MAG: 1-acyl-sn-glycerol-3-phosphate acyltransferase [Treponema sp.]|nr:1-acyl-sn-glycerol-3-phosphate acyltransferase [Treponema sp.]
MIKTVVCFAFVVLGVIGLVPFALLAVLLGFVGLRRPMSVFIYRLVQGWARGLIVLIGCKMTVVGRENVPKSGGICFVSNHASIADILMLLGYAGRPFGFVAKKELMAIPLLNVWISVLGGLFIDRRNPRKALKTINAGVKRIKAGGGMIIFPEGSRSRGKGLLPFRPGSFKLAAQSGAVIVPVALAGTYEVFERNYRANSCPVRITFCDPINVVDIPHEDRKMVLADRVRDVIGKALEGGAGS